MNQNFFKIETGVWVSKYPFFLVFVFLFITGFVGAQESETPFVGFSDPLEITQTAFGAYFVDSIDIDGDGDLDILSASKLDGKICWYENLDGKGSFGLQDVVSRDGGKTLQACDLDGDGDIDILSNSRKENKVVWYENLDGKGDFGEPKVIITSLMSLSAVLASDIDGDGDLDVFHIINSFEEIVWYENLDGKGNFGSQRILAENAVNGKSLDQGDMDGDGDMDIVFTSSKFVSWYENLDGKGNFGSKKIITTDPEYIGDVFLGDVDGDGDLDVVGSSNYSDDSINGVIFWVENLEGKGRFGSQHWISTDYSYAYSVTTKDLDGDGDLDLLGCPYWSRNIFWYENIDGKGTFLGIHIVPSSALGLNSLSAGDLDGDGDLDIFSASYEDHKVAWYENTDGKGTFEIPQVLSSYTNEPHSVYACDLDKDGDMDVLSASYNDNKIAWYENKDGKGTFVPQRIITTSAYDAESVYASDLDNDGDMDVLSASGGKIAWYENMDGKGSFGSQVIITNSAVGAKSVYACDVDNDGDMDVLSASSSDDKIAWYENIDGKGNFGSQVIITTSADGAESVFAGDMDKDGDMDVLSASYNDRKISWYENLDGKGNFGSQRKISTMAKGAYSVFACDLDRDGDLDVLSASYSDDKIAWYENWDGKGTCSAEKVITTLADGACSVFAVDLDLDKDLDVLSVSLNDNKIACYENINGKGTFGPQVIISTEGGGPRSIYAEDLDRDGDMDIISALMNGDAIVWFRNSRTKYSISFTGPFRY